MSTSSNNVVVQTVAGLNPDADTPLEYKIHTGMAEKFIRQRFKMVTDALIRTKQPYAKIDYDKDINLRSVLYSDRFAPMILTMPGTVINRSQYDPTVSSMFQNTDEDSVPIIKTYWDLILPWIYKPKDIKELQQSTFLQRSLKISRKAVHEMSYFSTLRMKDIEGEDYDRNMVFIVINPDRVFMDMLKDRDNLKQRISIRFISIKQTGQDTVLYKMRRVVTKRNKNTDKKDISRMSAALRGIGS